LAATVAKGGTPAISGPNTLVIRFPAEYNREKDTVEGPERASRIQKAVRKVTGQDWFLRVEVVPAGAKSTTPHHSLPAAPVAPQVRRNAREEAEKLPLIKRAMDLLGGTIQRVDDQFGVPVEITEERNHSHPSGEEA
jgi:hypothetical protein